MRALWLTVIEMLRTDTKRLPVVVVNQPRMGTDDLHFIVRYILSEAQEKDGSRQLRNCVGGTRCYSRVLHAMNTSG
jgi:hypothetical protein